MTTPEPAVQVFNGPRLHLPVIPSCMGEDYEPRKVLVPNTLPVLFLAGPIRNAMPWQSATIRRVYSLPKHMAQVFIACPARRIDVDLHAFAYKDRAEYQTFPRQRAWEQHYMYTAAEEGCILFWLSKEGVKTDPEKVYAHITMMELGKWIERKKLMPKTRLVIGADEEFPEWRTIKFEIETELPNFPIYHDLNVAIDRALAIATKKEK